jgi:hypothetical protein
MRTRSRIAIFGVFGVAVGLALNIGIAIAVERLYVHKALQWLGVNTRFPVGYLIWQNSRPAYQLKDAPEFWFIEYMTAAGIDGYQVIRADPRNWDVPPDILTVGDSRGLPGWVERPESDVLTVITTGYGWPLVSLYKVRRVVEPTPFPDYIYLIDQGGPGPFETSDLRLWWPGVAANTTILGSFSAILLFLCSLSVRAVRHMVRRIRGRCAHCGYSVVGLDARCPECGAIHAMKKPRRG